MDDYRKLENQPLQFVLAEFRFTPVMQLADYIPKLQDWLRRQYPNTRIVEGQSIHMHNGDITVSPVRRWIFVSADKKSAVDASQEKVVYVTANYPRFDGFRAACQQIIEPFASIVEPSLVQRIGLRYGDLVKAGEDEALPDLVNSTFIVTQEFVDLGKAVEQQRTETLVQTDVGSLAIRSLYGVNNLRCFPDIHNGPIVIEPDQESSERIILDFDHFWSANEDSVGFDPEDILGRLTDLHEKSREAFWRVTSDYARNKKWS
ncbi:MAG: TIGR04255 family protein [Gammaproteobacteria bacterium]